MRKLFIAILLLIIVGIIGYIAIFLSLSGEETSFANSHYRESFAERTWLRKLFRLNETGDAKSDYTGSRYSKILVEVDSMEGLNASTKGIYELAERIQSATGKPTSVYLSDSNITYQETVSTEDIDNYRRKFQTNRSAGDTAVIYVMILSRSDDERLVLGTTRQADKIILFEDALHDFTLSSPSTFANYQLSTTSPSIGPCLSSFLSSLCLLLSVCCLLWSA
jgi:hypothetical protein